MAFGKAILAGALGAVVFGVIDHLLYVCGIPVFNIVRALGTLLLPHSSAWVWFPVGLILNIVVGAIWAVFYAYFFWSVFPWRPVFQGLAFAAIPLLIAGLIMVPQLDAMNPLLRWEHFQNIGIFAHHLGLWGPGGLILGHALYGSVLGIVYTHPVGYPARIPRRVLHVHG